MKYTKAGTAMRAVASDPELALVSGIDTDRTILFAFMTGFALAGIAAILISFDDIDMTPTMGMNALMMGVVAVIIGGAGSLRSSIVGAALLIFIPEILRFVGMPNSIAANMRQIFYGGLLVFFMMFRPQGLLGEFAFGKSGHKETKEAQYK